MPLKDYHLDTKCLCLFCNKFSIP